MDTHELLPGLHVGKWMLQANLQPAEWIGRKINGRGLREPVNVLVFMPKDPAPEDSLCRRFARAGYRSRWGHSGGYKAVLGDQTYTQFPSREKHCISDRFWLFENNHGRCFGPHEHEGAHVFTAAFSRESAWRHNYVSFQRARDDFAARLAERTELELLGFVDMQSRLDADPFTGDHDGRAALLVSPAVPARLMERLRGLAPGMALV
jgi:hypothetical protein